MRLCVTREGLRRQPLKDMVMVAGVVLPAVLASINQSVLVVCPPHPPPPHPHLHSPGPTGCP
jgi:hypothetical protein